MGKIMGKITISMATVTKLWNITMFFMGKITISMAMFVNFANCESLPEGHVVFSSHV
jgi:hypothetical protein